MRPNNSVQRTVFGSRLIQTFRRRFRHSHSPATDLASPGLERNQPMFIVLIHWRIKPTEEDVAKFRA